MACYSMFVGFLRFDELVKILPCEISVQGDYMTLHPPRSKTDQLRKGDEIVIARSGTATCPVGKLEEYMAKTHMEWEEKSF